MKPDRKKYQLSKEALDSVLKQTDADAKLDLNKKENKGSTFFVVDQDSGEIQIIIPYQYNGSFYAAHFPSPVQLFYKQAIDHISRADSVVKSFEQNIEMVYQQSEESSTKIKMIDSEIFDQFIIHKISCLTSLSSTVEAFANEMIPEDFKILNNKNIEVGKAEIERSWDLKGKLKQVIPKIVSVEEKKYETLVGKFIEMNYLRNEFIHMKFKTDVKNFDPYIENFEKLINLNLQKKLEEVRLLVNLVKPNYL